MKREPLEPSPVAQEGTHIFLSGSYTGPPSGTQSKFKFSDPLDFWYGHNLSKKTYSHFFDSINMGAPPKSVQRMNDNDYRVLDSFEDDPKMLELSIMEIDARVSGRDREIKFKSKWRLFFNRKVRRLKNFR